MKIYATYCSAAKRDDPGTIPAIQRYRSRRIATVAHLAESHGVGFAILSGRHGLLSAEEPVAFYDHLLGAAEVDTLAARVAGQIRERGIGEITFFTRPPAVDPKAVPYRAAMEEAARTAGAAFRVREFEDSGPEPAGAESSERA